MNDPLPESLGGITAVAGLRVGHDTDRAAGTGCTVVLYEAGAVGGVDVRGAAPGTRETDLLRPENLVAEVHAVLLAGGSAFGLDAATGVMRYLAERDRGFLTGHGRVPIVPAAVLYDLGLGRPDVRPDADSGYRACLAASDGLPIEGSVGAGTGATVGKAGGPETAMKGGLGTAAVRLGNGVTVGALVAVNAFGDVIDPEQVALLAGARNAGGWLDSVELVRQGLPPGGFAGASTTLAVVATDAALDKARAQRVAQMAHDGFARTIRPAHTMFDGDVVFVLATGQAGESETTALGVAAELAVARAIVRAICLADSLHGRPAWRDLT